MSFFKRNTRRRTLGLYHPDAGKTLTEKTSFWWCYSRSRCCKNNKIKKRSHE
jgi:peptide subunit release factor RF-3